MEPIVDEALERYAAAQTSAVPPLLEELRAVTYAQVASPHMLTDRVEGNLLRLLVALCGARRVLEIGTFTGYSALMMASALPDDGVLVTCERDPEIATIARRFFARSADGHKIELRLGDALETVRGLGGPFDLCFLDADKERYPQYLELLVERLRPGGLLVADNVLWSGRVLDEHNREETTRGIRAFNARLRDDDRMEQVLLTVRDGVTLARKVGAR